MQTRILVNTTNSKITINDLCAISIDATSQIDITNNFTLEQLYLSSELFDYITSGDIAVNNGQRNLTPDEGKMYCTPSSDKPRENPLPYIYLAQANTLQSLFELHTESMELEESLEKCFVTFFDSKRKVLEDSNILYDGQGIYLKGNDISEEIIEDFEDISDWSEDIDYNNEIANISLDNSICIDGTSSIKINISDAGKFSSYAIKKTFGTVQDWSTYENICIYGKTSELSSKYAFCIVLKDASGNSFFTNISRFSNVWTEITFDILGCSFKNTIKEIIIVIIPNSSDNIDVNFDRLSVNKINSYQSTGYTISNNIHTYANVDKIYFSVCGDAPTNTSIQTQISLDGGSNWHIINDYEYEQWVSVSSWNEYEDFVNTKNVKVKIVLGTNDTNCTPQIDDFLIQWKVKV